MSGLGFAPPFNINVSGILPGNLFVSPSALINSDWLSVLLSTFCVLTVMTEVLYQVWFFFP